MKLKRIPVVLKQNKGQIVTITKRGRDDYAMEIKAKRDKNAPAELFADPDIPLKKILELIETARRRLMDS